jgi:hypothetical protein
MMSRSTTTTLAGRSSSMRRMRRRASGASPSRIFCGTNGCPSFLEIDPTTGVATCAICGFTRRTH